MNAERVAPLYKAQIDIPLIALSRDGLRHFLKSKEARMANTVAVLTLLFLTALAAAELGSSEKKDVATTWAIIDHEYIEYSEEELEWMKEKEEKKDGR